MWAHVRQIEVICRRGLLQYQVPLWCEGSQRIRQMVLTLPEDFFRRAPQPAEASELALGLRAFPEIALQPVGASTVFARSCTDALYSGAAFRRTGYPAEAGAAVEAGATERVREGAEAVRKMS